MIAQIVPITLIGSGILSFSSVMIFQCNHAAVINLRAPKEEFNRSQENFSQQDDFKSYLFNF